MYHPTPIKNSIAMQNGHQNEDLDADSLEGGGKAFFRASLTIA
jgi:hypothetical protein